MSYRIPTKHVAISILVGNLVLCGIFVFSLVTIRALDTEVKILETERTMRAEAAQGLTALRQTVRDTEDARRTLDSFFVKEETAISFIEELEALAKKTNVVLSLETAEPNVSVPQLPTLAISMGMTGTRDDIILFVGLLEDMPLRLDITLFELRETKDETKMWQGSARVVVKSFIPRPR